jgi:hypothetical protein
MKIIALLTFLLAVTGAASASTVDPFSTLQAAPNQIFAFSGLCSDCFGTATGTLTLTSDYILGTALDVNHFVSFAYDGTDLLSPFTITAAETPSISGSLPAILPGSAIGLGLQSSTNQFKLNAGFWCVGASCLNDSGTQGTFTAAATPEPASMGLFALGVAAVATLRRRLL